MWSVFTCPVRKVSFSVYFKPDPESQVPVWIHEVQQIQTGKNVARKLPDLCMRNPNTIADYVYV